jgi:prepilin-type N-terminal cleavage/methylation domain-containing protein
MKHNKYGFTLIEVMMVIAILAIVMGLGLANMQQSTPRYERETFIARLNALLFLAWQNSIKSGRVHRVAFDFEARRIAIASETDVVDRATGDYVYQPLSRQYGRTEMTIPETLKIEQFVIEGYDEMRRRQGKKSAEAWFYLMPGGLTQEVVINMFDLKDRREGKPRPIGLVLNPFSAQFDSYDTFQK